MRPAAAAAGVLAVAAAGMGALAFAGGDGEPARERAAAPAGSQPRGLAVWAEHGCGSCHALAAAGSTGGLAPDLGRSLEGRSAANVTESIVAPSAAVAPGFGAGMMPEDYAARIPADDLEALVEFLMQSARE